MNDDALKFYECRELYDDLQEYAQIEGTELGETCEILLQLHGCKDYVSKEFYESLIKEIKDQLDNFRSYFKIVEKTETNIITYRELEEI